MFLLLFNLTHPQLSLKSVDFRPIHPKCVTLLSAFHWHNLGLCRVTRVTQEIHHCRGHSSLYTCYCYNVTIVMCRLHSNDKIRLEINDHCFLNLSALKFKSYVHSTFCSNSKSNLLFWKWLICTYFFTSEYSGKQKLLDSTDSNLESSTRVTRVTRYSPTWQLAPTQYIQGGPAKVYFIFLYFCW